MELRASDTGLIIAATVDGWQGSAGDRRPYADQHGLSPADPIMMMPSPRSIARQNDTPDAHAAGYSRPVYIIGSSGSLLNGIGAVPFICSMIFSVCSVGLNSRTIGIVTSTNSTPWA
jgi:hypothetical protein